MPVDGITREYTWDDILCLILKDIGVDPQDRRHHEMWYLNNFIPPKHNKDDCIRVTKYEQDFQARLKEKTRDKL